MKRFITILFFGLCASEIFAEDHLVNFVPGEILRYRISWMGIPLAWTEARTDLIETNGTELIRIRMQSQTYKAYSHIYKVNDLTEVWIDPETSLPVQLDVVINEGSVHKSHFTQFDHEFESALFIDRLANATNAVPIESDTQEILSFLYSARDKDVGLMAENIYRLYVDGKVYDLGIDIKKETKVRLSEYGKVPSLEVEPLAEFDGLFLREGKIMFWISKQNRRMITCIKAKVPVGKITVKLKSVSGPGDDFWMNIKD